MTRANKLTGWIVIAAILGVIVGASYRAYVGADPVKVKAFADGIGLLTEIFLRLIKMIIAPLVFTTLVVGVAKLGDLKTVGRIGGKTMLWFISATFVSLLLGMTLVNLLQPGVAMDLALGDAEGAKEFSTHAISLRQFIEHVFPKSVFDAMAHNEILQIVVFALFFGVATAALSQHSKAVAHGMEIASHIILKMTEYVMNFAPFAVLGSISGVVARKGVAILGNYLVFVGEFYGAMVVLWLVIIFVGYIILGRRVGQLLKCIRNPLLLAFGTASSEAAFPKTMEELERFGCRNQIVSFVLPLGYSFNLDGSMLYMTFGSLFIAQAYGIHLSLGTQLTMLLVLMVTSKGIAGVPRASLVVIAATLAMFNIPAEGIALLLPVDHFLDMGRSATNVVGNAMATAVVSKWEGALSEPANTDVQTQEVPTPA